MASKTQILDKISKYELEMPDVFVFPFFFHHVYTCMHMCMYMHIRSSIAALACTHMCTWRPEDNTFPPGIEDSIVYLLGFFFVFF